MREKDVRAVILLNITGIFLYTVGMRSFAAPAQIAPGGASGIAILVNYMTGFPMGVFCSLFNFPILAIVLWKRIFPGKFVAKAAASIILLSLMTDLLAPGGRLSIITFHSLEDRIVKNRFRINENPCTCPPDFPVCMCGKKSKGRVVTRKPILPSEEELSENKRSKSAKLRVFEKSRR